MIRYFDIGTMTGQEINTMINIVFPAIGEPYEIYAFEASYQNFLDAFNRFPNINIYHRIIANKEGKRKLYHASGKAGHSIYKTKKNVVLENDFEITKCTRFSKWLKDNFHDLDKTFNILRYNIEGAELDLFRDLDKENMFKYFKIIKGCSGFDILKCSEISDKHKEFQYICDRNKIPRDHRWSWHNAQLMVNWIKQPVTSKEMDVDMYEKLVVKVKKENELER